MKSKTIDCLYVGAYWWFGILALAGVWSVINGEMWGYFNIFLNMVLLMWMIYSKGIWDKQKARRKKIIEEQKAELVRRGVVTPNGYAVDGGEKIW